MNPIDILVFAAIFLALVLLTPVIMSIVVTASIRSRRLRLKPLDERSGPVVFRAAGKVDPDAARWGFEFLGCFHCNTVPAGLIAAWRRQDRPVFLALYVIQNKRVLDIVSEFAGGVGLTTCNGSQDMFPHPPGNYHQLFPKAPLDELWRHHCVAEAYLLRHGAQQGNPVMAFDEMFIEGVRTEIEYVRTISLWPFRAIGWYFGSLFGRWRRPRLAVGDQHQQGLVLMPNEPGFEALRMNDRGEMAPVLRSGRG
jgi:hypothetical protein